MGKMFISVTRASTLQINWFQCVDRHRLSPKLESLRLRCRTGGLTIRNPLRYSFFWSWGGDRVGKQSTSNVDQSPCLSLVFKWLIHGTQSVTRFKIVMAPLLPPVPGTSLLRTPLLPVIGLLVCLYADIALCISFLNPRLWVTGPWMTRLRHCMTRLSTFHWSWMGPFLRE